jgi:nucleotide-binding universal stress UspA family protein
MTYKIVVVQLDASERVHPRLEIALRLAKRFSAHLTGLYSVLIPAARSFYVMAGAAEYFQNDEKLGLERRGALEKLFQAELARADVSGQWVEAAEHANIAGPRRGRCADLIIAGQDDPNDPESYIDEHFKETLVMSAGRPVMLIPYTGVFATIGDNVMVAWDGSREATRAVHDALPLLKTAKQITVFTVNGAKGEPPGSPIPGADIATVIARHGAEVTVAGMDGVRDVPVGELLLSRAADLGIDLIVMGAYGHARWQELIMGGATRTMLESMTVPVLMSH